MAPDAPTVGSPEIVERFELLTRGKARRDLRHGSANLDVLDAAPPALLALVGHMAGGLIAKQPRSSKRPPRGPLAYEF